MSHSESQSDRGRELHLCSGLRLCHNLVRSAFAVAAVLFAAKTPMPRSYAQKMPKASHAFTAKMCAGGLDSVGPDFVGVERLILGWYRMFVQIEGLICTIRGSL